MNTSKIEAVNRLLKQFEYLIFAQINSQHMEADKTIANHLWRDYISAKIATSVTTTDKMECLAEMRGYLAALGNNGLIREYPAPELLNKIT